MFDIDKWQEIWISITKHKLRTCLTALGVIWGIFMLIVLLGAGKGLSNGIDEEFGKFATNMCAVWSSRTTKAFEGFTPGRIVQFNNDDIKAIRNSFPEVKYLSPRLFLPGDFQVIANNKSAKYGVRGEMPDVFNITPIELTEGRFINQIDIVNKRKSVVLGKRVSQFFFGLDSPIGEYIKIKGVYFQVVGVVESKQSGDNGNDDETAIYIPITTMQQSFNLHNRVAWFFFTVREGANVTKIENGLKGLLADRHKVHPEDKQGIRSFNLEEQIQEFNTVLTGINLFVWVVGFLTIIAGVIGVSNIMLIVVKERTREIGIRKALGATPLSIITMVVLESVVITTFSGYLGLLSGTIFIQLFALISENAEGIPYKNPEVDLTVALITLTLLVITGTLAGLIPAYQAARIQPVEALKDE